MEKFNGHAYIDKKYDELLASLIEEMHSSASSEISDYLKEEFLNRNLTYIGNSFDTLLSVPNADISRKNITEIKRETEESFTEGLEGMIDFFSKKLANFIVNASASGLDNERQLDLRKVIFFFGMEMNGKITELVYKYQSIASRGKERIRTVTNTMRKACATHGDEAFYNFLVSEKIIEMEPKEKLMCDSDLNLLKNKFKYNDFTLDIRE
jgi:hypothetical protein